MPRYTFVCKPCPEHKTEIIREVFMSISLFSSEGRIQICEKCGKEMIHKIGMPAVKYKGKGFYTTDYPKRVPRGNENEVLQELEDDLYKKGLASEDYQETREATEDFAVNRWRNTKTGEKVDIPIEGCR